MLQVQIDEDKLEKIYREMVAEKLKELESDTFFWKKQDLIKHSKMCWSTIQEKFFFDPNFPKFKSDRDWRFPSKECKEFLEVWWRNQEKS